MFSHIRYIQKINTYKVGKQIEDSERFFSYFSHYYYIIHAVYYIINIDSCICFLSARSYDWTGISPSPPPPSCQFWEPLDGILNYIIYSKAILHLATHVVPASASYLAGRWCACAKVRVCETFRMIKFSKVFDRRRKKSRPTRPSARARARVCVCVCVYTARRILQNQTTTILWVSYNPVVYFDVNFLQRTYHIFFWSLNLSILLFLILPHARVAPIKS